MPHVSPQRLQRLRRTFAMLQTVSPRVAARLAFTVFLTPVRRTLDASDAPWLEGAKQHRVVAGRDTVTLYEWGRGRRTVVILHGWGSHAPRFAPLAQALVTRGWRVLAIDAPGHGSTPGKKSSLPQFIAALDATIRELGPAQALVGHSLGALAAAHWLAQTGEPGRAEIGHAVFISGPTGARFLMNNFVTMLGLNDTTAGHMLRGFTKRFGKQPEFWSALDCAARIHIPVLLVHDRDDDVIPFAHSAQLLAVLPQARMWATQGLGHSGPLRDATTIELICRELEQ